MSDAHFAEALARLDEHKELRLPLRRRDILGRLALKFLWRRQLKWQVESNIAARDAIDATWRAVTAARDAAAAGGSAAAELRGMVDAQRDEAGAIRGELDNLHRTDQNLMAGLNQRLYAAVGSLRSEISDLRLSVADKHEAADTLRARLDALENGVAELVAASRESALRYARTDLLLGTMDTPDRPREQAPSRTHYLELAVATLLDGPADRVRARRAEHLPVVRAAREAGANGPVFDMAPGRGEWLETLRSADIPVVASTDNTMAAAHCAELGIAVEDRPAIDALAARARRSLGAVTAFRYAERHDPGAQVTFFEAAALALQPGGVLVVETPTPESEDVRLDPLLVRPVHPHFARFAAVSAGFARLEIDDVPGTGSYRLRAWM